MELASLPDHVTTLEGRYVTMADPSLPQESAPHPADLSPEAHRLRSHLIGAVALLTRIYSRLDPAVREEIEREGTMERLARDFNSDTFSVEMARASGGWGLFTRVNTTGGAK